MRNFIWIAGILTLIAFVSCRKDYISPSASAPPPLDPNIPISFKGELIPMFERDCFGSGCHDKGQAPDLTAANAYDQLTQLGYVDVSNPEGSLLYKRMISTSKPMPPKGVQPAEAQKILVWIKQGALNN